MDPGEKMDRNEIWTLAATALFLLMLIIAAIVYAVEFYHPAPRDVLPDLPTITPQQARDAAADTYRDPFAPDNTYQEPYEPSCLSNEECGSNTTCEGNQIVGYGCNGICVRYVWSTCAEGCEERAGWAVCTRGKTLQTTSCEDQESGINPQVKGRLFYSDGGIPYPLDDTCQENVLRDFYCDGDKLGEAQFPCTSCIDGTCKIDTSATCVDTNPTRNPYIKSMATFMGFAYGGAGSCCVEDEGSHACRPQSDYLRAAACVDNSARHYGVGCRCVDGVCV